METRFDLDFVIIAMGADLMALIALLPLFSMLFAAAYVVDL